MLALGDLFRQFPVRFARFPYNPIVINPNDLSKFWLAKEVALAQELVEFAQKLGVVSLVRSFLPRDKLRQTS